MLIAGKGKKRGKATRYALEKRPRMVEEYHIFADQAFLLPFATALAESGELGVLVRLRAASRGLARRLSAGVIRRIYDRVNYTTQEANSRALNDILNAAMDQDVRDFTVMRAFLDIMSTRQTLENGGPIPDNPHRYIYLMLHETIRPRSATERAAGKRVRWDLFRDYINGGICENDYLGRLFYRSQLEFQGAFAAYLYRDGIASVENGALTIMNTLSQIDRPNHGGDSVIEDRLLKELLLNIFAMAFWRDPANPNPQNVAERVPGATVGEDEFTNGNAFKFLVNYLNGIDFPYHGNMTFDTFDGSGFVWAMDLIDG